MEFEIFTWVEAVGYLGLCAYIFAYALAQPRSTIYTLLAGDSLYAVHLLALGAISAGLMCVFAILRNATTLTLKQHNQLKSFLIGFTICMWAVTLWKYNNIYDILPTIGITISSFGMLYREDFWKFRTCMLSAYMFWLVYFIILASTPAILYISLASAMNIGTMAKEYRKKVSPAELCTATS